MKMSVRGLVTWLILVSFVPIQAPAFQMTSPRSTTLEAGESNLTGRWHVKFTFAGREEKNLVFDSQSKGAGSFQLLDTAPDSKPETFTHPAAWAQTTNERVSFSAEVELPIGTCCREVGTLIFKGKFDSKTSMSGKVIFVASTTDEENPIGFRSLIGTFTATRVP